MYDSRNEVSGETENLTDPNKDNPGTRKREKHP